MRVKRILSLALTLVLLVSLCMPCTLAVGQAALSVSSGQVKAGEEVTLTVQISNNPGMAAYLLYIYHQVKEGEVMRESLYDYCMRTGKQKLLSQRSTARDLSFGCS